MRQPIYVRTHTSIRVLVVYISAFTRRVDTSTKESVRTRFNGNQSNMFFLKIFCGQLVWIKLPAYISMAGHNKSGWPIHQIWLSVDCILLFRKGRERETVDGKRYVSDDSVHICLCKLVRYISIIRLNIINCPICSSCVDIYIEIDVGRVRNPTYVIQTTECT